jgi:hypothetical protein
MDTRKNIISTGEKYFLNLKEAAFWRNSSSYRISLAFNDPAYSRLFNC